MKSQDVTLNYIGQYKVEPHHNEPPYKQPNAANHFRKKAQP